MTQITGQYGQNQVTPGRQAGEGGSSQFRLLVELKEGAIGQLLKSNGFAEKDITSGHIYKDGKMIKVNGNFRQNGSGPDARLQISYDEKNPREADIDVDYREQIRVGNFRDKEGHLKPYNSDIRAVGPQKANGAAINNLERHNARYGKTNPLRNIPSVKY